MKNTIKIYLVTIDGIDKGKHYFNDLIKTLAQTGTGQDITIKVDEERTRPLRLSPQTLKQVDPEAEALSHVLRNKVAVKC